MDTLECLLTRRSIRKYSDKPIPESLIEELIRYAMYAPSAKNTRPWHFVVINRREILDSIIDFHPYAKMLLQAPCAIAVCGDENEANTPEYWPVDCSIASQNLLLAAHAKELGAVWLGIYPRQERMNELSGLLGLPSHIHPLSLISLGYPEQEVSKIPERFEPAKIHFNKF